MPLNLNPLILSNLYISTSPSSSLGRALLPRLLQLIPPSSLVSANTDLVYHRTSLHLVSRNPEALSSTLSNLIDTVVTPDASCANLSNATTGGVAPHPCLSMIDNIALLSPAEPTEDALVSLRQTHTLLVNKTQHLPENLFRPLPYGHAADPYAELSSVRRNNGFFDSSPDAATEEAGKCTIGIPLSFISNYNIRMRFIPDSDNAASTTHSSRAVSKYCKMLTRALRESDLDSETSGGSNIRKIEALTLPYGDEWTYEIACNVHHFDCTQLVIHERLSDFVLGTILKNGGRQDDAGGIMVAIPGERGEEEGYGVAIKPYKVGVDEVDCVRFGDEGVNPTHYNILNQ
jgi:hypothetical protein